jgi:hypothetical protein
MLRYFYWYLPAFDISRLCRTSSEKSGKKVNNGNKLGGQLKMYHCATVLDVARQLMWRYVKYRHRSCDDTWSSATNVKKYS